MENKIHLQITTAGGTVCDEMANYVAVPLTDGEAGILANHANMIGALNEGVVRYKIDDEMHFAAVSGGVMSVADNELIILARSAERAENINLARAQASAARAKERIAAKADNLDLKRAELSLHRALAREKAYTMLHKN